MQDFTGPRYAGRRRAADIARFIRMDLKIARRAFPPQVSFSVTTAMRAGNQEVRIAVRGLAPDELWTDPDTPAGERTDTPRAARIRAKVQQIGDAYNRVRDGAAMYVLHVTLEPPAAEAGHRPRRSA